jgi:KDO2-lipid IV(A) lauroyltransferase
MNRWYRHGFNNPLSLKLIFSTIPRVPKWVHPPVAVVTALLFFFLLKDERKAVAHNLRRVTGAGRARVIWKTYQVFYSFCDLMVSYCYVPNATHEQLLAMLVDPDRGQDAIDRCLSLGNGLIVWTAHVGNWEFASRLLEMHDRPANVVRAVEHGNPAEMILREMKTNDRRRIVSMDEDALAPLELLRALRHNEIVAIQGDRPYRGRSAAVPFFGRDASFPLGPFFLSYVSGAPVLPGVVVREGWLRYRVVMGEAIEPARTGDRDRDLVSALRQATRFLEAVIEKNHCQWFTFYRYWSPEKTQERVKSWHDTPGAHAKT